MKKNIVIIISIASIIAIILGIILSYKIKEEQTNKIEIIDATYTCNNVEEKLYEDSNYIYILPCVKSNSLFVKFENNNKILVKTALEEKKVTIEELIKAGLKVKKEKK